MLDEVSRIKALLLGYCCHTWSGPAPTEHEKATHMAEAKRVFDEQKISLGTQGAQLRWKRQLLEMHETCGVVVRGGASGVHASDGGAGVGIRAAAAGSGAGVDGARAGDLHEAAELKAALELSMQAVESVVINAATAGSGAGVGAAVNAAQPAKKPRSKRDISSDMKSKILDFARAQSQERAQAADKEAGAADGDGGVVAMEGTAEEGAAAEKNVDEVSEVDTTVGQNDGDVADMEEAAEDKEDEAAAAAEMKVRLATHGHRRGLTAPLCLFGQTYLAPLIKRHLVSIPVENFAAFIEKAHLEAKPADVSVQDYIAPHTWLDNNTLPENFYQVQVRTPLCRL